MWVDLIDSEVEHKLNVVRFRIAGLRASEGVLLAGF